MTTQAKKTTLALAILIFIALCAFGLYRYFSDKPELLMPQCNVFFINQSGAEDQINLNLSGYHLRQPDPQSGQLVWDTAGPNNFFTEKYSIKSINISKTRARIEISSNNAPNKIVVKRWDKKEWQPGNINATHPKGDYVNFSIEKKWKKSICQLQLEANGLYAIWVHFGEEWVEYSFMVSKVS